MTSDTIKTGSKVTKKGDSLDTPDVGTVEVINGHRARVNWGWTTSWETLDSLRAAMSASYTDDQYRRLTVARSFGARAMLQGLTEHVGLLAQQAGGADAWVTDPRREGLVEALAVLDSYCGTSHLDEQSRAELDKLITMSDSLDKRTSDPRSPR